MAIDQLPCFPPVDPIRHNHQYIEITVWSHFATGCRAEEDDVEWMNGIDDSPHQFIEQLSIWFHGLTTKKESYLNIALMSRRPGSSWLLC